MSNRTVLRKWSEIEVGVASLQEEIDALTVASTQYSRGWFQQLHVKGRAQFLQPTTGLTLALDADGYLTTGGSYEMREIPVATYDDLLDWWDTTQSAGFISGGAITDSGGGQIDVAAGTGIIKSTDSDIGENYFFDWAAQTNIALVDNSLNWVYIDYNAGAPQVATDTNIANIDLHTEIVIGRVYRSGATLSILNVGQDITDYMTKGCYKDFEVEGFVRASGIVTSETGVRQLDVTAGVIYCAHNRITIAAIDTSGAGRFTYHYNDGAWQTVAAQTQIDNVQYNNYGVGLANLTNNRYGVHWVYMCHDGTLHVVYGVGNYLASQAENATVPANLPGCLTQMSLLIAKIVIQKNAAVFTEIEYPWTTVFGTTGATDHGGLAGLGDDDHTQYLLADGTRALTANWDVGNFNITLQDLIIGDGRYIGSDSDTDAIQIAAGGEVTLSQTLILSDVVNAGVDTDKFLVLDATDNVDYRTGAEVLSDIGAAAAAHAASHQNGGADEISIAGLSGQTADPQTVEVVKNSGAVVSTRPQLNFIEGANITLTIADDAGNDQADITIASAAGVGEANTASNLGAGVGTYDGKVGVDLQFRSLVAASARISIALDAVNDEIDFDVSEANINHDNLGTRTHDGDTLQLDGVTSNGGAFDFTTSGTLTFSNTVALTTCVNAGVDTDKFLVLDSGDNIDFRTGAEVLSDIGAATAAHLHDGDTLQHDGVNSNGGDFDFTTTGDIRHIMGTGNALVITDVVTDDTNKKPAIRSEQYDSTGEPEGFTVIYVEAV